MEKKSFKEEIEELIYSIVEKKNFYYGSTLEKCDMWEFTIDESVCHRFERNSPNKTAEILESCITNGEINNARKYAKLLNEMIIFIKKVIKLQKKYPLLICDTENKSYTSFSFKNGKFHFGNRNWDSLAVCKKNMLRYTRLIRDWEVRCKKHPALKK